MSRDLSKAEYFTTGEVATICKVAPRTVHKWVDSGRLPASRLPTSNHRRVSRKDLISFLSEHGFSLDGILKEPINYTASDIPTGIEQMIRNDMEAVFSFKPLNELTESQLELRKLVDKMVNLSATKRSILEGDGK